MRTDGPRDPDDPLAAGRGCVNGLVIAGLLWLAFVAVIVWVVSR